MKMRSVARLSALGVAVALMGCVDNSYETTDLSTKVNITPLYTAVDEGEQVQYAVSIGDTPTTVTSWASSNTALATVNASGLVTTLDGPGGFAAITATLSNGTTKSASLTINNLQGIPLTSGVPVSGISGTAGQSILYRIFVPSGKTQLRFTLAGGTGDLDIYAQKGTPPTNASFQYYSYNGGNGEDITIANPSRGTWYVLVDVYSTGAGATLTATVTP